MPPTAEINPEVNSQQMHDQGEFYQLESGNPMHYVIDPGRPESRLPLSEQTELLNAIGLGNMEVMAVIGLSPDKKGPEESVSPEDSNDFNVWLVYDSISGSYAVLNGDAVEAQAENGTNAAEDYNFIMSYSATFEPANNKEIIIGRGSETLGMEMSSKGHDRDGNLSTLSKSHVRIGLNKSSFSRRAQVEITDLDSTNGASVKRGIKEKDLQELITEVPSFETEESSDDIEAARTEEIARLEVELKDPKFNELKKLLTRKKRHLADKAAAQKAGAGGGSTSYGQYAGQVQREIDDRFSLLDTEYKDLQMKKIDLRR